MKHQKFQADAEKAVVDILQVSHICPGIAIREGPGMEKAAFDQFKYNPKEFIMKAAALINEEKAMAIMENISYRVIGECYSMDILTESVIKGKLGINAI